MLDPNRMNLLSLEIQKDLNGTLPQINNICLSFDLQLFA